MLISNIMQSAGVSATRDLTAAPVWKRMSRCYSLEWMGNKYIWWRSFWSLQAEERVLTKRCCLVLCLVRDDGYAPACGHPTSLVCTGTHTNILYPMYPMYPKQFLNQYWEADKIMHPRPLSGEAEGQKSYFSLWCQILSTTYCGLWWEEGYKGEESRKRGINNKNGNGWRGVKLKRWREQARNWRRIKEWRR